jgi:hypothetical protein
MDCYRDSFTALQIKYYFYPFVYVWPLYKVDPYTHYDIMTSASWLRPVCGGFHNLIRLNCGPFFASCRRHRVLTLTYLDACLCAAYLTVDWNIFNLLTAGTINTMTGIRDEMLKFCESVLRAIYKEMWKLSREPQFNKGTPAQVREMTNQG